MQNSGFAEASVDRAVYERRLSDLCCRHCSEGLPKWNVEQVPIYSEMLLRNLGTVQTNGTTFDPDLLLEQDDRRCFASYSFFSENVANFSDSFHDLVDCLSETFPEHVLYRPFPNESKAARLHYTYMQHIGFEHYNPAVKPSSTFVSLLCKVLENSLGPFTITYMGLIPLRSGIVMIGFPSADVNASRNLLRNLCKQEGIEVREPYLNNIVHSTLLRFTAPLRDAQLSEFHRICEAYRTKYLGRVIISSFSSSAASWKMSKEEINDADAFKASLWSNAWSGYQLRSMVRHLRRCSVITHRGLDPARSRYFPESSLDSFTDHIFRGFSIEFDPFLSSDGYGYVSHDSYIEKDGIQLHLSSLTSTELDTIGVTKLVDVFDLISSSDATSHALHLKGNRQQRPFLEYLVTIFNQREQLRRKILVFDVPISIALDLKRSCPGIQLGASVAHDHDIERYNNCVHGTLVSVEDFLENCSLYDWAWLDEWDTVDASPGQRRKSLISSSLIETLHNRGIKVAAVSPELHATSPGLLGGEFHEDSSSFQKWKNWVVRYIDAGGDALCTDWPELVYELMVFGK
jgi:hypothetical protein